MTAYPTFCAASPMKPRHDPSCERRGFSRRPVHQTDRVDPHRTAIPDRNALRTYAASSNLIPIGMSSPKTIELIVTHAYHLQEPRLPPRREALRPEARRSAVLLGPLPNCCLPQAPSAAAGHVVAWQGA